MTTAAGTYPSTTRICHALGDGVGYETISDVDYPCGQQIEVFFQLHPGVVGDESVVYVPPDGLDLSGDVRVRFYIHREYFGINDLPDDTVVLLSYVSEDGIVMGARYIELQDAAYTIVAHTVNAFLQYYTVYFFAEPITTDNGGGYFVFRIQTDEYGLPAYVIDSFQIEEHGHHPPMCPIPGAAVPVTVTPTPTETPAAGTPTATPAGPTRTPYPTAVGDTPFPTQPNPIIHPPTIEAESTPTPWPAVSMPNVVWPTIDVTAFSTPGPPPTMPVPTIASTVISGSAGDVSNILATVGAQFADGQSWAELSASTTVSTTTGTIPPDSIIFNMISTLGLPITYAKTIGYYLPNAAPHLVWILVLASLVVFSIVARFGLPIIKGFIEIIGWLWGLLPFT